MRTVKEIENREVYFHVVGNLIERRRIEFNGVEIGFAGDLVVAQEWPSPLDESADEKNDAEIFRAVVESMRQWTLHKQLHHRTKREVSKVCYEDVGCFEDTGPFSYLEMLPSPPKDVGTRYAEQETGSRSSERA